jgi:hypothetical protein
LPDFSSVASNPPSNQPLTSPSRRKGETFIHRDKHTGRCRSQPRRLR